MKIIKEKLFLIVRDALELSGFEIAGGNDTNYTLFRKPDVKLFYDIHGNLVIGGNDMYEPKERPTNEADD